MESFYNLSLSRSITIIPEKDLNWIDNILPKVPNFGKKVFQPITITVQLTITVYL